MSASAEAIRERYLARKRRARKLWRLRHPEKWKAEKKRWKKLRRERGFVGAPPKLSDDEWIARHRANRRGQAARYRKRHPEKVREAMRAYEARHPGVRKALLRRYRDKHREEIRRKARLYQAKQAVLFMIDARLYASFRTKRRVWEMMRRKRIGIYRPRFHLRIPDWCCKGFALDGNSQFLAVNLTPAQRAYAKELAIERREWRRCHKGEEASNG